MSPTLETFDEVFEYTNTKWSGRVFIHLNKKRLTHELGQEILLYDSIALSACYHEPVTDILFVVMVEYGCAAAWTNIIFPEIIIIEFRGFLKPVDGQQQSFKIPLLSALRAFLNLFSHMLFHVLDVALRVLPDLLVIADILFSRLKILEISLI